MSLFSNDYVSFAAHFVAVPAVVGVAQWGTVALGHTFSVLESVPAIQVGVLSALQTLGANLLFEYMYEDKENVDLPNKITGYFVAHVTSGTAIYALAALAFKVGLIASLISLPGAACLILANFSLALACTYLTHVTNKHCNMQSNE